MCGIAGLFSTKLTISELLRNGNAMTDAIAYRGPDDFSVEAVGDRGCVFGHRRLSIIDLSPLGRQPMVSESGRYTISFNGEIYNFAELKKELLEKKHSFRGGSDTEVMLAAFEEYGIKEAVKRFNGMFAFAVWDDKEKDLILVRDRFGVKPLYYGVYPWGVAFASELKPFLKLDISGSEHRLNREAARLMIQFCYVPAPQSIFENILKLNAGSMVSIGMDAKPKAPEQYWRAEDVVRNSLENRFNGSFDEAVSELDLLLRDSVKLRMISDVPLGVFLSGGIDSSTVTALMQAQSSKPVKSFAIGFNDKEHNEAVFAKKVAEHLKTDHTELYVTPEEAQAVITTLPAMYDEPFADSSQIPTFLVSKLARQKVTVSLSGDGGDELFGGYGRFFQAAKIWKALESLPNFTKPPLSFLIKSIPTRAWTGIYKMAEPFLPDYLHTTRVGEKAWRLAEFLNYDSRESFYESLLSFYSSREPILKKWAFDDTWGSYRNDKLSFFDQMMLIDAKTYLTDDILVKVDRASMAVSLEAREPLLDYRIFEFAWRMPREWTTRGDKGKWLLRQVLYRYVPAELVERPKQGFAIPLGLWLRGPLKDWADSLLTGSEIKELDLFDEKTVQKVWREHHQGVYDCAPLLWNVISMVAWYRHYKSSIIL